MYKIQGEQGERLDILIAQKLNITRGAVQRLIEDDKVQVNGNISKASYRLKASDEVYVFEFEDKPADIKPKEMELNIIYEDEDIIIIDKDKDTVVHPGNGNYEDTIVNALMFSHKDNLSRD